MQKLFFAILIIIAFASNVHASDSMTPTSNSITPNSELMYTMGKKHGTDKVTHHGYHRFYPQFVDRNISNLLEIGGANKQSIYLWLEYFPKAHVYGLDINPKESGERYTIFKADQANVLDLQKVVKKIGKKVDLIIDDGSHIPDHQMISFEQNACAISSALAKSQACIVEA